MTSKSGPVRVQLPAKAPVVSVVPSSREQVKEESFLGIASVPGPNGTEQAREVVVSLKRRVAPVRAAMPGTFPALGRRK